MSEISVRYARWDAVGEPFTVIDGVTPAIPADGWILAEIDMATICGSDLHTVMGHRNSPAPSILGHEQVGRVVGLGRSARPTYFDGAQIGLGDRVTWSVTASCGACEQCRAGREQKCARLRKYGHAELTAQWPLNGGFATHCLLAPGTTVVPVPGELPDRVACPASCATATVAAVLDAANRDSPAGPRRVLITGAGMLGVTAAAMASRAGGEVVVIDPDADRRALAARFGADRVLGADERPSGFDIAIELSGNAAAVETCLASVGVGGRAVLAGSVSSSRPVAFDPERLVRNLVTVTGVHNYRPGHLETAVRFLADNHERYPFAELVSGGYGLDRIDDAVRAAAQGPGLRQAIVPAA
ncbi:zinc-binding dehydrogenase [Nocardia jiangxiensis]|uniref:alcohol dehydrogenase n=1 Tax=Nocardia jiangxiensis TaxID=282685 RepID=A0ABW6S0Y1_9NOCA